MKTNMGRSDRIIRLGVAAIIVALYMMNIIQGTVAIILLLVAAVFVLTSAISFCPLYTLIGLNTCRRK